MHVFLSHINVAGIDLGLGYDAVDNGQPEASSAFVIQYLLFRPHGKEDDIHIPSSGMEKRTRILPLVGGS